jgi:hypothetical protein
MKRSALSRMGLGITIWKGPILVLAVVVFLVCVGFAQEAPVVGGNENPTDDVTYLAQYGTWIDVPPFGSVWQPSVSSDWRPFVYGHWVWTDAGWAWVSYEPYGWLVYHYGNWDYLPDIGWFWIEGGDWSAAQVEWLSYDGYCSWAPLPPVGVVWPDPWLEGGFGIWCVVRDRDLDRSNIGHYRMHKPPFPRDPDRRDVFHGPLAIHDFERIAGRTLAPEPLRHGPVPVYMHPRQAPEHHEMTPGEMRPEPRPVEPVPSPSRPPEPHQVESMPQPAPAPPENRAMESPNVQLHRMILPESERARVKKYSPQFEKRVMVPRSGHGNAPRRSNKK